MAAGLQVWNDASFLQIDGSSRHTVFRRKGTVLTQSLAQDGGLGDVSVAWIPCALDEFIAISGPTPFMLAGRLSGQMRFHVFNNPGTAVTYWVFGPYTPSGTRVGLEIYNEAGTLVYDSGRLPMRVTGEVGGLGVIQLPQGRTYALVPWAQHVNTQFSVMVLPPQTGQYFTVSSGGADFGSVDGAGLVSITYRSYWQIASAPKDLDGNGQPPEQDSSWDNGQQNKYTVLDVTGY